MTLPDHSVVGDVQAETSTAARWLGGEERVEHTFDYTGRRARAVVLELDDHPVIEPERPDDEDDRMSAERHIAMPDGGSEPREHDAGTVRNLR